MTPFQKAGYTIDTKFKVLKTYGQLNLGDTVTIRSEHDRCNDYDEYPIFITEDGREEPMCLPGSRCGDEELAVLVDSEEEDVLPVSISMTLEEGIALQEFIDNTILADVHGELLKGVGSKVDKALEGKVVKGVCAWEYYGLKEVYDLRKYTGSFEALLNAMIPSKAKEEALAEAKELRKQLEELEKQIDEMGE